jgi:hypothetical protein
MEGIREIVGLAAGSRGPRLLRFDEFFLDELCAGATHRGESFGLLEAVRV